MSAVAWLIVLGGLAALLASLTIVGLQRYARRRSPILWGQGGFENQYAADTAAGPVVITRVLTDRGWTFEIETYFKRRFGDRGDMVRLHYDDYSLLRAKQHVDRLVAAHLAGQPQSGHTPGWYEEHPVA